MALPPFDPVLSGLPSIPDAESSVSDLCSRYGIARQSLYPRLNACGVSGEKRAQRTFFSAAEVFQLDACHYYLSLGYGLKEVAQVSSTDVPTESSPSLPSSASSSLAVLTDAIAQALDRRSSSPLDVYRDLGEAADQSYLLSTTALASIIGFSNSTLHGWNRVEERFGFIFSRFGQGRWRVSRQSVV